MQNINLLFGGDTKDVDIICVPSEIANKIGLIANDYFTWMHNNIDRHDYWILGKNKEKVLCYETESFVWWINNHCGQCDDKAGAYIVTQHTELVSEYLTVNF